MHPSDNYHDYNDGQEVVNLLNMPSEMELPSAADINNSNQGMWSDLASLAHMTPSFPSPWGWAEVP